MTRTFAVLAALGVCAGIGVGATPNGSDAWAADILVARGGLVETVSAPAAPAPGQRVAVFRGEIPGEAKLASPMLRAEPTHYIVGGDRLWMVDTTEGRIVACYLANTTQASERAIRCVESAPN